MTTLKTSRASASTRTGLKRGLGRVCSFDVYVCGRKDPIYISACNRNGKLMIGEGGCKMVEFFDGWETTQNNIDKARVIPEPPDSHTVIVHNVRMISSSDLEDIMEIEYEVKNLYNEDEEDDDDWY